MSWLIDADVLSQPAKRRGDPSVIAWLEREARQRWLRQLLDAMEGRVLGFSVSVAQVWAEQQRAFDRTGTRMPLADSYIAATAKRHGLTIATGNDRDFRRPGLEVFNPFKELA